MATGFRGVRWATLGGSYDHPHGASEMATCDRRVCHASREPRALLRGPFSSRPLLRRFSCPGGLARGWRLQRLSGKERALLYPPAVSCPRGGSQRFHRLRRSVSQPTVGTEPEL